jgi:hypothetical protein
MSLHPSIALSDFMRDLKAETSKMLKQTSGLEQFTAWSEGYLSNDIIGIFFCCGYTKNNSPER